MGVIYIGDRNAGKTHLAMELAKSQTQSVKATIPNYENLAASLFNLDGEIEQTKADIEADSRQLDIQVRLPSGYKQIDTTWIDTPGEIWRKSWQTSNPDQWKNFLKIARESEGILLIVEPYRDLVSPNANARDYATQQQWCKRFDRWIDFFRTDCSRVKNLVICLNKADRFCDLEQEAFVLDRKDWHERHTYVLRKFFRPIQPKLEQLNRIIDGLSVNCFITSIYNRYLLELPWIYLGTYLDA